MNPASRVMILLIRCYQRWISPCLPPVCRFWPTCSHYAVQALAVHGLLRGSLFAAWRLLRCQPFGGSGYDPVPGPGAPWWACFRRRWFDPTAVPGRPVTGTADRRAMPTGSATEARRDP